MKVWIAGDVHYIIGRNLFMGVVGFVSVCFLFMAYQNSWVI